jgi:hypothetical protein
LRRLEHPPYLEDEEGRQALRRLVEKKEAGIAHEGAADGQHLLLAARQLVGAVPSALVEPGKSSWTRSRVHGPRPLRATSRFSRTVREGKTRRPWGTSAIPLSTIR